MATVRNRGPYQWQAIVKRKGIGSTSKTFLNKKDAEDWAKITEAAMIRGHYIKRDDAEKTTLAELINRYRETILPSKRGKHFGPALTMLETNLGKLALSAVSSKKVADFRDKRLKAGLSASTVRKEINLLSKLIDLAGKEWGITLPSNPCAMVSRPTENNARTRRLSQDEERYLLAACEQPMALLIRLALETAARLGELLAVHWNDVDAETPAIRIRGIAGRGTKNSDPFRDVPLSKAALVLLDEMKALDEKEDQAHDISGRMFYWWKASDSFNKSWVRAVGRARKKYLEDCAKAGRKPDAGFLVDLHFHDLRHEATSRLFELGVYDIMEIAQITGHKSLASLKRYVHLRVRNLAKKRG